mmetsp:Transcript_38122/g.106103  ORF Transcript_38122/g.106103 Transcript_38122/m.106103 type:complete len:427 (+) Transcript_38122:1037-2317(+)
MTQQKLRLKVCFPWSVRLVWSENILKQTSLVVVGKSQARKADCSSGTGASLLQMWAIKVVVTVVDVRVTDEVLMARVVVGSVVVLPITVEEVETSVVVEGALLSVSVDAGAVVATSVVLAAGVVVSAGVVVAVGVVVTASVVAVMVAASVVAVMVAARASVVAAIVAGAAMVAAAGDGSAVVGNAVVVASMPATVAAAGVLDAPAATAAASSVVDAQGAGGTSGTHDGRIAGGKGAGASVAKGGNVGDGLSGATVTSGGIVKGSMGCSVIKGSKGSMGGSVARGGKGAGAGVCGHWISGTTGVSACGGRTRLRATGQRSAVSARFVAPDKCPERSGELLRLPRWKRAVMANKPTSTRPVQAATVRRLTPEPRLRRPLAAAAAGTGSSAENSRSSGPSPKKSRRRVLSSDSSLPWGLGGLNGGARAT